MKSVKRWLDQAAPEQKLRLAKLSGVSINYLQQVAGNHKSPSPRQAARIEQAWLKVGPEDAELYRWNLCNTCRKCPWRAK